MKIDFVSYSSVNEMVQLRIDDPHQEKPTIQDFTVPAFKQLIERDDPKYPADVRAARTAFIAKGGLTWLLQEIQMHQKKELNGQN